jgi:hypothetical protein
MATPEFSPKGLKLIEMYEQMADQGYERGDGKKVESAYNDFELKKFRDHVSTYIKTPYIKTVLDYGCGGSNWDAPDFEPSNGQSAKEYFDLENVYYYEPARDMDERQKVDCVVNFDVLEHIFISDVPAVLRDICSYAKQMVIINVACYDAAARLPNGENAHITVRKPQWWKGVLDVISIEHPHLNMVLFCSTGYNKVVNFNVWRAQNWQDSEKFVTKL